MANSSMMAALMAGGKPSAKGASAATAPKAAKMPQAPKPKAPKMAPKPKMSVKKVGLNPKTSTRPSDKPMQRALRSGAKTMGLGGIPPMATQKGIPPMAPITKSKMPGM